MGVHIHGSTMPGGLTPICNECGIALCMDISENEYKRQTKFWDEWICKECNGGESMKYPNFRPIKIIERKPKEQTSGHV